MKKWDVVRCQVICFLVLLLSGLFVSAPQTLAQSPAAGPTDPMQSTMPDPTPPPADAGQAPAAAPDSPPSQESTPSAAPAPAAASAAPAPAAASAAPAPAAPAADASAPPVPTPNPAVAPAPVPAAKPPVDPLAGISGPEVKILGYSIRPPKDYSYAAVTLPDTLETLHTWRGSIHQDGSVTLLVMQIAHYTPRPGIKDPREMEMREMLKGLQAYMGDFVTAPMQNGTVGALPALRTTLTGVFHKSNGSKVISQGFLYVVEDGQIIIDIMGLDEIGYFVPNFPTLNSAALSFHK